MTSAPPFAEVIGDPIEHSRSPEIHRFWLDALELAGDYRRTQVAEVGLADHVNQVRADPAWRGSNVTMPLKRAALDLADAASDRAIAAGAANLLLPRDGRLFAANTDVGAIATLIDAARKAGRMVDQVTLFGSGGAARGALVALKLLGLAEVRIQARDMAAAGRLAAEFGLAQSPRTFLAPVEGQLLINATPLGMAGQACLNCDVSQMTDGGLVFDMVSNPADTPLVLAARARGLGVITGLDMLIEQAATSFGLMFGQDPPRDRDGELRQALSA